MMTKRINKDECLMTSLFDCVLVDLDLLPLRQVYYCWPSSHSTINTLGYGVGVHNSKSFNTVCFI